MLRSQSLLLVNPSDPHTGTYAPLKIIYSLYLKMKIIQAKYQVKTVNMDYWWLYKITNNRILVRIKLKAKHIAITSLQYV